MRPVLPAIVGRALPDQEYKTMRHLIDAVRSSIKEKNWYAALTMALTLPDIAAKLDGRPGLSQTRFVSWFDDYLLSTYSRDVCGRPHVFLSGNDCYALRCAYLHEGDFAITAQSARRVLERVHFIAPAAGKTVHRNQVDAVLQLQVDLFCEEVCTAVENWLRVRGPEPSVTAAIVSLPSIDFSLAEGRGLSVGTGIRIEPG
jgi:hypothetical protein